VRHTSSWQDIPGDFDTSDAEAYAHIVKNLRDGRGIAEIGLWEGRSFCSLIAECQQRQRSHMLYGIDTFSGSSNQIGQQVVAANTDLMRRCKHNITATGYNYWMLINAESVTASSYFIDHSLGCAFIDATHTREALTRDIRAWLPKIRKGGYIAGHDYTWKEVSVTVNDLLGKVDVIGSCWIALVR